MTRINLLYCACELFKKVPQEYEPNEWFFILIIIAVAILLLITKTS